MNKHLSRRDFLRKASVACGSVSFVTSHAESAGPAGACPQLSGKTINWIIPNAPGSGYDMNSRLVEPHLEKILAAELVLKNVIGAGGVIGARTIMNATPDGRTLGPATEASQIR
jgi:tripartite-type tricarboxylate transporter receptor subunit TctC